MKIVNDKNEIIEQPAEQPVRVINPDKPKKIRKLKEKKIALEETEKELQRKKQEYDDELKREEERLKEATDKINAICEEYNLFCGRIVNIDDCVAIMRLLFESKDPVSVPFALYPKIEEE